MEVGGLVGQEGGVGGQDAVLAGQVDQFIDEFGVLAVEVDLVEDVADAADGPEAGDELVAAAFTGVG